MNTWFFILPSRSSLCLCFGPSSSATNHNFDPTAIVSMFHSLDQPHCTQFRPILSSAVSNGFKSTVSNGYQYAGSRMARLDNTGLCLVLPCVLCCAALSCLVLSRLVLSFLSWVRVRVSVRVKVRVRVRVRVRVSVVLSCIVLCCVVLSCLVLCGLVLSCRILCLHSQVLPPSQ